MQSRMKILTVLATMTAMFALLPALSAVAAEPLDDGTYAVTVGESTYELQVSDGTPLVAPDTGVDWFFSYNEDNEVLDEFTVVVDDQAYEVEIGEDGKAYVKPTDGDDLPAEPEAPLAGSEEPEDDESEDDESEEAEVAEAEVEEDDGHGELVSAVAQCAPSGKVAREAGLPNHGQIVSAVAGGEALVFTVAETEFTVDPAAGAEAICAELSAAQAAGEAAAAEAAAAGGDEDDKGKPAKADQADGEAPGKSGDAPGKAKKNGDD